MSRFYFDDVSMIKKIGMKVLSLLVPYKGTPVKSLFSSGSSNEYVAAPETVNNSEFQQLLTVVRNGR